jgi:hypothetical protein
MTVVEKAPEVKVRSQCNAGLVVDPMDIAFEDVTRDTVMIRVKIKNESQQPSNPASVRLESAPFGAFVPWRPLAILRVPALKPGESRELNVKAARPHPTPLGDFNRVPPMALLTAVSASPDESSRGPVAGLSALLNLIRKQGTSRPANATGARATTLPPDLWELLGREQPHWAGNINVFVNNRTVERHVAKALRIYSGRTNLAMFVVGDPGKRDAYAFEIVGLPSDWTAALHSMSGAQTLVIGSSKEPIQKKQWVEADRGMMLMMLAVHPPMICEEGKLQVQVTRRSCGKKAVVEFDLDPTAQGAGCYVA